VATPFGVRIDYLGPGDEPLYSEYLPGSLVESSVEPHGGPYWRGIALCSVGLWLLTGLAGAFIVAGCR
jgi:hypothetical protein